VADGADVLDYPPNHFLRWNAAALRQFLSARDSRSCPFSPPSFFPSSEQSAGIVHTTQMINMALRTGMSQAVVSDTTEKFFAM